MSMRVVFSRLWGVGVEGPWEKGKGLGTAMYYISWAEVGITSFILYFGIHYFTFVIRINIIFIHSLSSYVPPSLQILSCLLSAWASAVPTFHNGRESGIGGDRSSTASPTVKAALL